MLLTRTYSGKVDSTVYLSFSQLHMNPGKQFMIDSKTSLGFGFKL